jgi:hypothetical protein
VAAEAFAQSNDSRKGVHDTQHFAVSAARPALGLGDQQAAIIGAKIERGVNMAPVARAILGWGKDESGSRWAGQAGSRRRAQDRALGSFDHALAFGGLIPPDQFLLPRLRDFRPGPTGALRVDLLNLSS